MSIIKTNNLTNDLDGSAPTTIEGLAVDGASAVAVVIDAPATLAASGSKVLSIRNGGVEVASVDKDGNFAGGSGSVASSLVSGSPTTAIVAPIKIKAAGSDAASMVLQGTGGIVNPTIYMISATGDDANNVFITTNAAGSIVIGSGIAGNILIDLVGKTIDASGLGAGGSIKLKSANGTTFTATISNAGAWVIV